MKINVFLVVVCFLLFNNVFAQEAMKKKRDRLRLGYYSVWSEQIYQVGPSGELVHVSTITHCSDPGEDRCRASSSANSNPTFELDVFDSDFTAAEKVVAEEVLIDGDSEIENGNPSGTESNTVQFVNTTTGLSYYRTFTYVWTTNFDDSIDCSLSVSEPF